ncbi:MAG: right-handed parallel beta-helix repeat-containing protein [Candidatus Odinarchaeota archaeon]
MRLVFLLPLFLVVLVILQVFPVSVVLVSDTRLEENQSIQTKSSRSLFEQLFNFKIAETIQNDTIIENDNRSISETIVISSSGNLTIINSVLDFSDLVNNLEDAFALEGGILMIRDSILKNGYKGIDGDSNGSLVLENVTFTGFTDDIIDLKGDYQTKISNSFFYGGRNGIQLENSQYQANITGSIFSNTGKDAINTESIDLYLDSLRVLDTVDDGLQIEGDSIVVITNTFVSGSGGDSVKFRNNALGSVLLDNITVQGGNEDGIQMTDGGNLTIIDSKITGNRENGIQAIEVVNLTIKDSTFDGNGLTTGNGIELVNITNAVISRVSSSNNRESGFTITNAMQVTLDHSDFVRNSVAGAEISETKHVDILWVMIENNNGSLTGADGFRAFTVEKLTVNHSVTRTNSGSGFEFENVMALMFNNTISLNSEDGISAGENTVLKVLNNSITANQQHGIHFHSTADATVRYNNISSNAGYGIFVPENRTLSYPLDANYNYWGSDKGPHVQLVEKGSRDDYSGPVNITLILTGTGLVKRYVPPNPVIIDFQALFTILLLAMVGIAMIGFIYYWHIKRIWIRETKPLLMLLIGESGLALARYDFGSVEEDEHIIAGLITAINSFSSTLLGSDAEQLGKKSDTIEEIKHQAFTMLMRPILGNIVALVVQHSNRIVQNRLNRLITELGEELRMIQNNGDNGPVRKEKYENILPNLVQRHLDIFLKEN